MHSLYTAVPVEDTDQDLAPDESLSSATDSAIENATVSGATGVDSATLPVLDMANFCALWVQMEVGE